MDVIGTTDEIPLRGEHNVRNVLAACAIAGAAGADIEAMREAMLAFQPVEHRLEVVREWMGITWINDSIATAPERVLAALDAYHEYPLVLLLGGRDKDLPWDALAREAVRSCHAVITFGEAGLMIAEKIAAQRAAQGDDTRLEQASTLEAAVDLAADLADEGDVVLLSPGGTSYDAYEDFAARGVHFRELVKRL
jgi:UDP-N-acetylmuramoylalanine--D-glutamate ligase